MRLLCFFESIIFSYKSDALTLKFINFDTSIMNKILPFCNKLFEYERFPTQEVEIGHVKLGHRNPILVQSMVNTNTMDTDATVAQVEELVDAGCPLVRITAQGVREAENLENIKRQLQEKGVEVSLVADIHFAPKAAEVAAKIVDKVRINPGNYVDKKVFKTFEHTEEDYQNELKKIEAKFVPFLETCRKHRTAIRIGSNHGSLSDRIVNRYGNTPEGMVEAAMEFLRICKRENFTNVVVSMKASNTQVMTQSTRLLAAKMRDEKMHFPIHLGVTEAGNGEEARIKSAMGIGALLSDGIGDTIRVSLTEHPKKEVPVAKAIIKHYSNYHSDSCTYHNLDLEFNPYKFQKRPSRKIDFVGGNHPPIVIAKDAFLDSQDKQADLIYREEVVLEASSQKYLLPYPVFQKSGAFSNCYPLYSVEELRANPLSGSGLVFVACQYEDLEVVRPLIEGHSVCLIVASVRVNAISEFRAVFATLKGLDCPVILRKKIAVSQDMAIKTACDLGPVLIDGFGDGVWVESEQSESYNQRLGFNILQAARVRMSKTEFISCPSCGRTLFDLESTSLTIKKELSHLKHLKIGIMGCIVNGPGEMADADYGYVGSGIGKVSLYKGQNLVQKNIPSKEALGELINLIKENGDWVERETSNFKE